MTFLMECKSHVVLDNPVDVCVVGSTALAVELLATNRTAAMRDRPSQCKSEAVPNEMNE